MEKTPTCYVPFSGYNIYSANIREMLLEEGYESFSIRKVLTSPKLFFRCKVFNFNWFEEAPTRKEYLKKIMLLRMLKIFGKKIVFTLHNKHPHEISANRWSHQLTSKMCDLSDVIIGLCPETADIVNESNSSAITKLRVIPHPNYIHNYEDEEQFGFRERFGFKKDDMVFLFLGVVSPYKNLDILIDIIERTPNSKIKLLIAGKPSDKAYGAKLEKRIEAIPNIVCDLRLIPDEEMASYYRTSDVVILPYKKSSYLNSGAVYLSFSLRKTVICPMIGSIKMLDDKSIVYAYDYSSEDEHARELEQCILKVCSDYSEDKEKIRNMGMRAYEYVKTVHSDDKIKKCIKKHMTVC